MGGSAAMSLTNAPQMTISMASAALPMGLVAADAAASILRSVSG